ncbi:MAG: 3-isopropylmalate dehydratase large subunit, partial [bacterium]|nr:3-isopropylmalate dehydratase large subunit [bacterium]
RQRGLPVHRPDQCLATMDHSIPTTPPDANGKYVINDPDAAAQLSQLEKNCAEFSVPLHALGSEHQGIVHVIAPELGCSQPGMTIVCGDSHTSTHGAFGALAFGIGTGQVGHVLATQCLLAHRPKTFEIRLDGALREGVSAKDVILAVIAEIGTEGGTGYVFEYTGSTVRGLDMEERMTICNMSIEGGARAGLMAPDETTFSYLAGRPFVAQDADWDRTVATWRDLPSDPGATFARSLTIDAAALQPMVTYGTSPGMGVAIQDPVPDPASLGESQQRDSAKKALAYMGLEAGKPMLGQPIDVVFVGSCTNGRLSDLRDAARVVKGRQVHNGVRMLVVPGSQRVKREAEVEGLHEVFRAAGAEWREPGCSMCLAMNDDRLKPGQLAVSTSNRNFEGRQGPRGRTVLASPFTAAASAIAGSIADVREVI